MKFLVIGIFKAEMKNRNRTYRNYLLVAGFLLASQLASFAQGSDSISSKGLFVGMNFGLSQSQIVNKGTLSVAAVNSGETMAFGGAAEVGYFFTGYIGLSTGIGFSSFKSKLTLDAYQNKLTAIDSENESYELRVTGTNIQEDQTISYLTVPICLNLRLPLKGGIGLFLQSGVNLAIPLTKEYTTNGAFTYKGYYSQYNVLLENLSTYGFPTSKATTVSGTLGMKSFSVFAVATAGLDYFVSNKIQLALAGTWNRSLSDISAYAANPAYQLSPAVDKINSVMGGSSSTTLQSIGVTVKLRYYLNF